MNNLIILFFVVSVFIKPILPEEGSRIKIHEFPKGLILKYTNSSNFVEVNVKDSIMLDIKKNVSNLTCNVKIVNEKSTPVFIGNKNSMPFQVYIGGLPNGKYKVIVVIENNAISEEFEIMRKS